MCFRRTARARETLSSPPAFGRGSCIVAGPTPVYWQYHMHAVPPWQAQDRLALTLAQREVVLLIGEGLTNREIAARLGTTPGWVGTQVGLIVQRLGPTCRADTWPGVWSTSFADQTAGCA